MIAELRDLNYEERLKMLTIPKARRFCTHARTHTDTHVYLGEYTVTHSFMSRMFILQQ